MNGTWIGSHRQINIGPIIKPWTHLMSPCAVTRRPRPMRALVFVYIMEEVPEHFEYARLGYFNYNEAQ